MDLKNRLHNLFLQNEEKIETWLQEKANSEEYPFYCSFDIRESDKKIAPVDANMFPAGFNNICQADRDAMGELFNRCIDFKKLNFANVGLFCEDHRKNPYYWDNVYTLVELFKSSGKEVFVFLPEEKPDIKSIESASGRVIEIHEATIKGKETYAGETKIDLIVSNNDYSSAAGSWISRVETLNMPPLHMGWHRRRKNTFFEIYNELIEEFAELLSADPFCFQVETKNFPEFNLEKPQDLVDEIKNMKESLEKRYQEHGIEKSPYFFVKNSFGTYGLGVTEVRNPEDVLSWNYKARKKMKATKGGGGFGSVIIQEGIPTVLKVDGATAEAVIYLLGCGLAGGFFRTNERKDDLDSLNAPGAVFSRMCFSDYEFDKETKIQENVYGTIARVGAIALSLEAKRSLQNF